MKKPTFEELQKSVDALRKENDLLKFYLYDTVSLRHPDGYATSPNGVFGATMYRCETGNGGYLLIKQFDGAGVPQLVYLDDINREKWPAEICILADRMRIQRAKICEGK